MPNTGHFRSHRFQAALRRGWHPCDVSESRPRVLVVDDDRAVPATLRPSRELKG